MSEGTKQQRLLARYARHSRLLGWILALVSVVVIGVGIFTGGGVGVFIAAVGASLMPPAVVNAWLDPLLREDAAHDMQELLGVREDLLATGFQAGSRAPAFDLKKLMGRTAHIQVLPLNLAEWMRRDYAKILDLCGTNGVAVSVYLPAPDEPWCTLLAHRDNTEPEAVQRQLVRGPDQLLRAWDSAEIHEKSRIEVFFYDGVPSTGLTLFDGAVAVELGPAIKDEEVAVPGHVLLFDDASDLAAWARRQLRFTDLPKPPTSAGLRPLANSVQGSRTEAPPQSPASNDTESVGTAFERPSRSAIGDSEDDTQ